MTVIGPVGTSPAGAAPPSFGAMRFLVRFGAVCGVFCGLFIAIPAGVEAVTGEITATSLVLGVAPALAAPLLVATQLAQGAAGGRLAEVGYAVNAVGLGLFAGVGFTLNMALFFLDRDVVVELLRGPTKGALLGSAAVFVAGTVLYAVAMFRAGIYPRGVVVSYGVSLSAFALAAPLPDNPVISGLHVVVGATLIWLAEAVWRRSDAPPAPAAPRRVARATA
jgi:hypothetical protein